VRLIYANNTGWVLVAQSSQWGQKFSLRCLLDVKTTNMLESTDSLKFRMDIEK